MPVLDLMATELKKAVPTTAIRRIMNWAEGRLFKSASIYIGNQSVPERPIKYADAGWGPSMYLQPHSVVTSVNWDSSKQKNLKLN